MIRIVLVGDVFISRSIPDNGYDGFKEIVNLINAHEVRFANLETTVHDREGYPSAFPGGTWAMAAPQCMADLKRFGFNILNTANNHSMDYSHPGLLATLRVLKSNGIQQVGSGKNLADASAPAFIECSHGRIAVIGATSSFHDSDAAGHQKKDMPGRPGINPLRHKSVYQVPEEDYHHLQRIAQATGINDYHDQAAKEGYLLPGEEQKFAGFAFIKGEKHLLHTTPLEKDMERITKSIVDAKKQSDYVMVTIHSHQFSKNDKKYPPEFIRSFAQSCIDAGATVVAGHGPHVLRGIEIYRQGIIFYGLGNFIFQNETVSHLPADFYEKYSLSADDGVGSAMEQRTRKGTVGLCADPEAWNGVIVSLEIRRDMKVRLYPVELGFDLPRYRNGLPRLSRHEKSLRQIQRLSVPYGTKILIKDGIGHLRIKA